jgi:hypothetical protein
MATENGADRTQIEILERSRGEGQLSTPLAIEAGGNFFTCLDQNGIGYFYSGVAGPEPFPNLDYGIYDSNPIGDDCYTRFFEHVDLLYQTQPAVTEAADQRIIDKRDELITCIKEHGGQVSDEGTLDEIRSELWFLYYGFHRNTSDPEPPPGFMGVDCLGAVGLDPSDM